MDVKLHLKVYDFEANNLFPIHFRVNTAKKSKNENQAS